MRALDAQQATDYRRIIEQYEAMTGEDVNRTLKIKGHLALPAIVEPDVTPLSSTRWRISSGPDIMLFGASIFAKNGRDPRYVSWHRDSTYFGVTPHEEVTVWVALTPANSLQRCSARVAGLAPRPTDLKHVETYAKDNMLAKGQTLVGIDEKHLLSKCRFSPVSSRCITNAPRTVRSRKTARTTERIGFAFFYVPAHVRSATGRRRATLVRGADRFGHWDADTLPEYDCDPRSMA